MHARADSIVAAAKSLVNVRYRHQGRSTSGLDCAGLVILTAQMVGISSFDTARYSPRPNANEFTREMMSAGCRQIPVSELAHGDIVRFSMSGWPVHIGVYEIDESGNAWYVHAYLPHKKVTRDPMTADAWKTVSSVWRFPE